MNPKKRRILWICLSALLLLVIVFVILIACGVFRSKDNETQVSSRSKITVPTEIENQKTGGVMRYSYNMSEKSLTIRVKGNVEVPFCFPFLPNRDPVSQSLSFIAFNCFDYSPAIILSFSPLILSGEIDTVQFEGSMNWDPITYRFQVDESQRVSQCQVEQNGKTTNLIFDYDSSGRLLSVSDQKSYTFNISYEPNTAQISAINILNRSTAIQNELTFNSKGQISRLRYHGIRTGKTIVAEYTYHRNGMIRTEDILNIHNRFSYNADGLLTHPKYNGNSLTITYSKI